MGGMEHQDQISCIVTGLDHD